MKFKEYWKNCEKKKDVLLHSVVWMIISIVAAYPNLCLNFDTSIFSTQTRDEYCNTYLLPIMLFLLAFIFDFFFSIKDLNIGEKRGLLFKLFTISICIMIFFLCLITVIPCIFVKILLFCMLWLNISFIKGLTVLMPGEDDLIKVKEPINNYK